MIPPLQDSVGAKIDELVSLCKSEVSITFNGHTVNYQTIEQYIVDEISRDYFDCDDERKAAIVAAGRVVVVQFYQNTPVGFCVVVHHDLGAALDEALAEARA